MKQRTQKEMYELLTQERSRHGKCSDWIRRNRRRRACGLPQLRVKRTFADGSMEIGEA